jgi:hypothetical protein
VIELPGGPLLAVDLGPAVSAASDRVPIGKGGRYAVPRPDGVRDLAVLEFRALASRDLDLLALLIAQVEPVVEDPRPLRRLLAPQARVPMHVPQSDVDEHLGKAEAEVGIEVLRDDHLRGDDAVGQRLLAHGPSHGPQAQRSRALQVARDRSTRQRLDLRVPRELVDHLEERHKASC